MLKCFLESTWEEKENNFDFQSKNSNGCRWPFWSLPWAAGGLQKNTAFQHCQLFQGELAFWEKIHLQYLPKWIRHLDPEAESVLQGADLLQYEAPFFCCRHFFWNRNFGRIPSFHQKKGSKFPPQIKEQQQTTIPPQNLSLTLPKTFCDFCYF